MSWEPYYCASIKNNLWRRTWKALPLSYNPIIVTMKSIGFKQSKCRATDQSDVFFRIFLWQSNLWSCTKYEYCVGDINIIIVKIGCKYNTFYIECSTVKRVKRIVCCNGNIACFIYNIFHLLHQRHPPSQEEEFLFNKGIIQQIYLQKCFSSLIWGQYLVSIFKM